MTPEFVEIVRRMREAQQHYFHVRTSVALTAAKRLELQVDRELKVFAQGAHQPSLLEQPQEEQPS